MPKRMVRSAAQRAASKRNLEKARKAKAIRGIDYGGKKWRGPMIDLYHVTTEANAKSIRANGFQWKEGRNMHMGGLRQPIWFSTIKPQKGSTPADWVAEKFGGKKPPKQAMFSIRVRYSITHRDRHVPAGSKHIQSRVIPADKLRGVKIREIK